MPRVRAAFFLALLLVTVSRAGHAQGSRIVTRILGFDRDVALDTLVYAQKTVNAPVADVVRAVQEAYAALKLPKAAVDSLGGAVFNRQFSATTLLAGERISTWLHCGEGPQGENADTFRISMAIATFVRDAGGGSSRIGTGFAASARNMGGASGANLPCASTGMLEARIADLAAERIATRGDVKR